MRAINMFLVAFLLCGGAQAQSAYAEPAGAAPADAAPAGAEPAGAAAVMGAEPANSLPLVADNEWRPVTRDIALWTHALSGAFALVGGGYYAINGLRQADVERYKQQCAAEPVACAKAEATELERRTHRSMGAALLVHALGSASGLVFLSANPSGVNTGARSSHHALYTTSAVLALGSALTLLPMLSSYGEFNDEKSNCFDAGSCITLRQLHGDVADRALWPILISAVGYGVSVTTALVTPDYQLSATPVLSPSAAGAMLAGRF